MPNNYTLCRQSIKALEPLKDTPAVRWVEWLSHAHVPDVYNAEGKRINKMTLIPHRTEDFAPIEPISKSINTNTTKIWGTINFGGEYGSARFNFRLGYTHADMGVDSPDIALSSIEIIYAAILPWLYEAAEYYKSQGQTEEAGRLILRPTTTQIMIDDLSYPPDPPEPEEIDTNLDGQYVSDVREVLDLEEEYEEGDIIGFDGREYVVSEGRLRLIPPVTRYSERYPQPRVAQTAERLRREGERIATIQTAQPTEPEQDPISAYEYWQALREARMPSVPLSEAQQIRRDVAERRQVAQDWAETTRLNTSTTEWVDVGSDTYQYQQIEAEDLPF